MELSNEFEVPVPIEQAWAILTDIERIVFESPSRGEFATPEGVAT